MFKVGLKKSSANSLGTNSLSTYKNVGSESLGDGPLNLRTPIVGLVDSVIMLENYNLKGNLIVVVEGLSVEGSKSGLVASSTVREYLSTDPQYVHIEVRVPKHAHNTSNSVCNQPRKYRRSNRAMQFVAPTGLPIPTARGGFVA